MMRLGLSVFLVFVALNTYGSSQFIPTGEKSERGCLADESVVTYVCEVRQNEITLPNNLMWQGSAFSNQCPDPRNSVRDDRITFDINERGVDELEVATCGNFISELRISLSGSQLTFTSTLTFTANTSMNGTVIRCMLGADEQGQDKLIIGIIPPPPADLTLVFPTSDQCDFNWRTPFSLDPAQIKGYDVLISGDCGNCDNSSNILPITTTTFTCIGFIVDGQNCEFDVHTVSSDCEFPSENSVYTVTLDDRPFMMTSLNLDCSTSNKLTPFLSLQWQVDGTLNPDTLPADAPINFPSSLDSWIILTPRGQNVPSHNITVPRLVRSYNVNPKEYPLVEGLEYNVTVWRRHMAKPEGIPNSGAVITVPQSVVLDATLDETQDGYSCIRMNIVKGCKECSCLFHASIAYTNGSCSDSQELMLTSDRIPFENNYSVCVPFSRDHILTESICYEGVLYFMGEEGLRTLGKHRQINTTLLGCSASTIPPQFHPPSNRGVFHNQLLELSCGINGMFRNGNLTMLVRCVNGRFLPSVETLECVYTQDYDCQDLIIATSVGWIIVLVAIIVLLIVVAVWLQIKRKAHGKATVTHSN